MKKIGIIGAGNIGKVCIPTNLPPNMDISVVEINNETTEKQTEFINRLWESAMNDYSDYKRYKCQKGHRYVKPTWKCIRCGKVLK